MAIEAAMAKGDARAQQARLAQEFEHELEHKAAVAYANAIVDGLADETRRREHTLAYQFAREYFARLRGAV